MAHFSTIESVVNTDCCVYKNADDGSNKDTHKIAYFSAIESDVCTDGVANLKAHFGSRTHTRQFG
jgi:hypothetical protein